ncbi:MAG: RNA-binding domain-containing protein, partial [Parcubacteria group bacterium]
MTTILELDNLLTRTESEHEELKAAPSSFRLDEICNYCAALANEGGGRLYLGVNNDRNVVGTQCYQGTLQQITHEIYQQIKWRVQIEEVNHPKGRVVIFHIPGRLKGGVVYSNTHKYRIPMRVGESLSEMDDNTLHKIHSEVPEDFSATTIEGLTDADLDQEGVSVFRQKWTDHTGHSEYLTMSIDQLLIAAELKRNGKLTHACLILLGKREKISELLPTSEIIFEWRQDPQQIEYDSRKTWREPFFKIVNEIWQEINARNLQYSIQEGLFKRTIKSFSEEVIREALLNAVAHREYRILGRSIFINASPEEFFIESPGGLPNGVRIDNILRMRDWRNRLIAETFQKAGLVERSGQGMDLIFQKTIIEGKGMPDLSDTDDDAVRLKIPAKIRDKYFVRFIEKVQEEKQVSLRLEVIIELEKIRVNGGLIKVN